MLWTICRPWKVEVPVSRISLRTVRNVVLGSIAAVTLTGALATAGFVYWVTRDLPGYDTLANYEPPIACMAAVAR
jgi:membrane carboxypeptidase/penicillin-binding protein